MCDIKKIGPVISKIALLGGYASQVKAIEDAIKNEQWDQVITQTFHLTLSILALSDNCFTGDTLVATEDGQIRIDEIEVGDKVWAYDIYTGETALKEVTKIYVHEVDEILHLHTSCGDIDTTTNHPFYVIDKGWVAAGDLSIGDAVYLIDGSVAIITGSEIEKLDEPIKVYNLEVADFNTYFVGDNSVLVHNYDKNTTYPDQDVYVLYDDKGNIQYVGRSKNGDVRLDQHSRSESRGHLNGFIVASGIPYEAGRGMEQIGIDRFGTLNTSTDFNNQINGIGQNNGADIINIFMSAGQKYAHLFDEALKMIRSIVANGG